MSDQESGATRDLNAAVAAEIRAILARRGWKGSTLAALLGVNEMWVSRRLRGTKAIDVDDLERIANALGMRPVELLGLAEKAGGDLNIRSSPLAERPVSSPSVATRRPADTRPSGRGQPLRPRPERVVRSGTVAA